MTRQGRLCLKSSLIKRRLLASQTKVYSRLLASQGQGTTGMGAIVRLKQMSRPTGDHLKYSFIALSGCIICPRERRTLREPVSS